MSYLAIYRRFRPKTFDEVIGQEHVVTTLINQINTDRVGHAYLFCGARGTGKTSVAKIFARAINCRTPVNGSPCGKCETCKKLSNPSNLDILEIDAASNNKVDNVQEIRVNVQYPPVAGRYKVYIIDEVHMLTTEAFNALLKTLEEPPKHAVFILATTEPHKLPATILSRCMRFDFHLVADKVIQGLIEKIYDEVGKTYDKEAVALIAKSGEGSVRDALSLADLCLSYSNEKLTYKQVIDILGASDSSKTAELIKAMLSSSVGEVLRVTDELGGLGKSMGVLTKDLLNMVRDLLVVKTCKEANDILLLPQSEYETLSELAAMADNHRFLRILEIFSSIETDLRYSTHPKIVFEAAAVKAALPPEDYNIDALLSRITALENKLADMINNNTIDPAPTQPTIGLSTEKAAYKPVNDDFDSKNKPADVSDAGTNKQPAEVSKPSENTKTAEAAPTDGTTEAYTVAAEVKASENKKESADKKEEKRLVGFDYVPDDIQPPVDEVTEPDENQMSFDTMALTYSDVLGKDGDSYINDKTVVGANSAFDGAKEADGAHGAEGKVIRDRVPDARLWGNVIRKLRSEKHIMLWIACQELDTEIKDGTLYIICDGENEYSLLSKNENLQILGSIVSSFAPYAVKVVRSKAESLEQQFEQDIETVNEMFDGKIKVIK